MFISRSLSRPIVECERGWGGVKALDIVHFNPVSVGADESVGVGLRMGCACAPQPTDNSRLINSRIGVLRRHKV
jgi:hypothetical protein